MAANWWLLLAVIGLLAASAFFVAAEFALVSARRTQIEPLAVTSARARTTLKAMEEVSVLMATAQLGITLCGVIIGAAGEPAVAHLLEPVFAGIGLPEGAVYPVSFALALLLVVGAHVALGEMVPKNIALAGPERSALALAPPLFVLSRMLGPIVRGLNAFASTVVRWTGREPRDEVASTFTRDEVAAMVTESSAEGLLDDPAQQRLASALRFDTHTVATVLLPAATVVTVPASATPADVERASARTGFSRFPVAQPDGRWTGYLHLRDALATAAEDRDEPMAAARIRPLPAVSADTGLRTALDGMRRQGHHLAAVTGSDGVVVGAVTLEDVVEVLVGEVRDATRRP